MHKQILTLLDIWICKVETYAILKLVEFVNKNIFWKYKTHIDRQQTLQTVCHTDFLAIKAVPKHTLKYGKILPEHPVHILFCFVFSYHKLKTSEFNSGLLKLKVIK